MINDGFDMIVNLLEETLSPNTTTKLANIELSGIKGILKDEESSLVVLAISNLQNIDCLTDFKP